MMRDRPDTPPLEKVKRRMLNAESTLSSCQLNISQMESKLSSSEVEISTLKDVVLKLSERLEKLEKPSKRNDIDGTIKVGDMFEMKARDLMKLTPNAATTYLLDSENKWGLCTSYWYPVRVCEVRSHTEVKIEWIGFEGSWDCLANVDALRPPLKATTSNRPALTPGTVVEGQLLFKKGYAWVDGTIESVDSNGNVVLTLVSDIPVAAGSIYVGHIIDRVYLPQSSICGK